MDDFDKDRLKDILLAGNDVEIKSQPGRLDAFHGLILLNDKKRFFTIKKKRSFDISGAARNIEKININGIEYYIITINNNSPVLLKNND